MFSTYCLYTVYSDCIVMKLSYLSLKLCKLYIGYKQNNDTAACNFPVKFSIYWHFEQGISEVHVSLSRIMYMVPLVY